MNIIKSLFKKSSFIRSLIRSYRYVFGQPNWKFFSSLESTQTVNIGSDDLANILFCTGGGGYTSGTHIESMLSLAIQKRGYNTHVLLCDEVLPACLQSNIDWDRDEKKFAKNGPTFIHCASCFRPSADMYKSINCKVHRISEQLSDERRSEVHNLARAIPFNDIKNYTYEGIPVGEHAYAGTLRFYAKAELNDQYAELILRRYFEASLIATIAVKNLCKKINFNRAILHHGIYVPQGVFAESLVQLKIPITTWHVAYRKETFIFSHGGTYHRTLMTEPISNWENITWSNKINDTIIDYLNSRWFGTKDWIHFHKNTLFDKDILYKEIGIKKNKPYILLLTNVMWDAQLHYPNNAFDNMLEWIKHTIKWFSKINHLQLVIRVHPAEVTGTLPSRQLVVDEIHKQFNSLPDNIFVIGPDNPISTYVIAEDCNAAIIYGTKMGVELAAKGIPVIVAGEAWVRNKGFSIDVSSPKQYEQVLESLPFKSRLDEAQINRAKKYAYHFFFRRMIPLPFMKASKNGVKPFDIQISSLSDLEPNKSKGLDIICDGILNGYEFIYPCEHNE